jgi:GNAT superfamily N-acetyltransferase
MSNQVVAGVTVRKARLADLDTIVRLRLSLLREHPEHPIYGRLRADAERRAREVFTSQLSALGETMFLAERDGRVVGILRCAESIASPLLDPPRYAYISSVFVDREHRRTGVLRALLDAAERWCADRGLTDMRLHSVSGDEVSEGAWAHLGFAPVETVRMKRL